MSTGFNLAPYRGPVFVEIGIGDGQGTAAAIRSGFTEVHSVELLRPISEETMASLQQAMQQSAGRSNIMLYFGRSADALRQICPTWRYKHITFLFHLAAYERAGLVRPEGAPHPILADLAILREFFASILRTPSILLTGLPPQSPDQPLHSQIMAELAGIRGEYNFRLLPDIATPAPFAAIPQWWDRGAAPQ